MNIIEDSVLINLHSSTGTPQSDGSILFSMNGLIKPTEHILYNEISLISAQIPVSFYSINETNNILSAQINGANATIAIPYGNYNYDSFVSELVILMPTFTISLDEKTGKLTFVSTTAFTFYVMKSTCNKIFGFSEDLASVGNSLTLPHPLNILGPTQIKIVSKYLSTKNRDSTSNTLAIIPINVTAFSLISYENNNHKNILQTDNVSTIDILLTDELNNVLDFNNIEWTLVFKLTNFRNIYPSQKSLFDLLNETK